MDAGEAGAGHGAAGPGGREAGGHLQQGRAPQVLAGREQAADGPAHHVALLGEVEVAQQLTDGDAARAFAVGGMRLEAHDVLGLEPELRGILDGDHALGR